MLNLIAGEIGGYVRIYKDTVLWVENDRAKIFKILKIFEQYPPLTHRLRAQIKFLYACASSNDVN